MDWSRYLSYALMPLRAVLSQRFYYDVLFKLRGVGLVYLLILCAFLALPGTYQVKQALNKLQSWELSSIVAKLPPSYISPDGTLSPNNPQDAAQPLIVRNSKGNAVLAYNLEGLPLQADAVRDPERPSGASLGTGLIEVPITLSAHSLNLNTVDGAIAIAWTAIYGESGGSFEPLATAQVFDSAFRSSYFALWGMVTAWLFSLLSLVVLVAACLLKPLCSLVLKLKISFATALRLNAYGSTLVALLLLLQFFYNYSLSYMTLCLIPLLYSGMLMMQVRKHLKHAKDNIELALNVHHPMYPMFDLYSRVGPNHQVDRGPDYSALDEAGKERRRANLARNLDIINVIFKDGHYQAPAAQGMRDYQYYQNMGKEQDAHSPVAPHSASDAPRSAPPAADASQQHSSEHPAQSSAGKAAGQAAPHDADPWAQLEQPEGKGEPSQAKGQGSTFIP